jgi:DNA sulfur modification protein DndB
MANKTYIPAFKARVGDWNYYICQMKYAEVARAINFAFELGGNKDLSSLIQRGLHKRTEEITDYLLNSEHRFLGSLIIATWGGDPEYISLRMDDPDGMLSGLDREFGVLTLDGTHSFFALDGQHRLRAIKDAIKQEPALGTEDICVLLVTHQDTQEGRERTQRLFTNINRNAKTTTSAENIALDVDDGFAILTRRLLTDHSFLAQPKRVRVFSKPPTDDGAYTLAGKNIPKTDPSALTSITVLYEISKELCYDADPGFKDLTTRPNDEVLEQIYETLAKRIDQVLKACGNLQVQLENSSSAKDIRAPKGAEESGHAFMRPVVQQSVCRSLSHVVSQDLRSWPDALKGLSALSWTIGQAPWTAVFNTANNKMMTAKENTALLDDLLRVHLAPGTRAEIKRARKDFKDIAGGLYPVSEEELAENLPSDDDD